MPGVFRYSVDLLVEKAKLAADLGIPAICMVPSLPVNTISAAHGAAMVVLTSEP